MENTRNGEGEELPPPEQPVARIVFKESEESPFDEEAGIPVYPQMVN